MKLENVSQYARALSDAELRELLESAAICRIATVRADGRPHIAPMWFLYRDGAFYFMQRKGAAKQKIKNLQDNPNVALSVDTCASPYRVVLVEGTAEMTEVQASEIALAIAVKYLGEQAGRDYHAKLIADSPPWLIKVTPSNVMHFQT
jgi:PPOX class probable F420-dependent enzyme